MVTDQSRLCDKTLEDVNFRETYKAAVIAVQKKDKSEVDNLAEVCFVPGDIIVLQADDTSPLLVRPPQDFYSTETRSGYNARTLLKHAVSGIKLSSSSNDLKGKASEDAGDNVSTGSTDTRTREVWGDLRVLFHGKRGGNSQEDSGNSSREFLTAVSVSKKSEHIGKTVAEAGLDRQSGLFLVGVERPVLDRTSICVSFARLSVFPGPASVPEGSEMASLTQGNMPTATIPVPPEGHLKEADVLWFAGPATAIADLRKIPGLVSLEDEELKKIGEKLHDRRLVQGKYSFVFIHIHLVSYQTVFECCEYQTKLLWQGRDH